MADDRPPKSASDGARPPLLELVGLGSAALVAELLVVALVLRSIWSPAQGAAAHLAVAAALGFRSYRLALSGNDLRFSLLLVLTTAFLGPLGAAGTLVTVLLAALHARGSTPFAEWYASLFPERENRTSELVQRIRSIAADEAGSVAHFVDLLYFGTLAQKQELVSLLAREFRPLLAPVLRLALHDANNAVRVQAASSIARIEDDFLERSLALAAAIAARPGDAGLLHDLARHHDDYAGAGILDGEREEASRGQALEAYRAYLAVRPADLAARAAVARLLLRERKHEEACGWLEASIGDGFSNDEIALLYMEALFEAGRFRDLRAAAARHHDTLGRNDALPLEAAAAAKLWAGLGAPPRGGGQAA